MDANVRDELEKAVLRGMDDACKNEMRWGVDDCSLWVANIIHDVLGYDPAKRFRNKYLTRDGAYFELGKPGLGFAVLRSAKKHGWLSIEPDEAEAGDVGLAKFDDLVVTVICRTRGWFVGRSVNGAVVFPSAAVRLAWSVV